MSPDEYLEERRPQRVKLSEDEQRAIVRRFSERYGGKDSELSGVGIGKEDEDLVILVSYKRKLPSELPEVFGGLRVRIIGRREYWALSQPS